MRTNSGKSSLYCARPAGPRLGYQLQTMAPREAGPNSHLMGTASSLATSLSLVHGLGAVDVFMQATKIDRELERKEIETRVAEGAEFCA